LIGLRKLLERISKLQPKSPGYYELKKHKSWFKEGCSKLLDRRKKVTLQRIQDPRKINGSNLNTIRCEVNRCFRKKRKYLKSKINELATHCKKNNIRDMRRGKKIRMGYEPASNLVKDENGDLLADSHNILNRWKNYFSQLLDVHRVIDVRNKYS
jgi:hypothetical protein